MPGIARRVLWTNIVPFALLFACATGDDGDPTSLSGFSAGPSNPVTSVSDATTAPATTTEDDPTGDDATRGTTMRETTTETPEPPTTSGDDTTSTTNIIDTTGSDESSSTTGPVILCGNGAIDPFEDCDGALLGGKDCVGLGFSAGTLTCDPQCLYDKTMCTNPSCGDGTVDPGEECDCGQQGANCTAPQLGNAACTTLPSPNGSNYSAGTLACNSPGSCSFNKGGCQYCGDGIKNAAEQCDAADLGGASCQSQGFAGGSISCTPQCGFNTGGCSNCGNNIVDAGEVCDGANFNGQSCQSVDAKFAGGSLQCSNCSSISSAGCNSGNCCVAGGAGACSAPSILNCVCAFDSYCCTTAWDGICVNGAKNSCGAVCP